MNVVHFQRKAVHYAYSIEAEFDAIRDELALRPGLDVNVVRCPLTNRGLHRWAANAAVAVRRQGDVNHITGDVHYLAWVLERSRTVLTVHDVAYEQRPAGLRRRAVGALTFRGPVNRVAAVTVPSTFTRDRLIALTGVDPARVELVPLCISPAFTAVTRPFDTDRPTILHVGTLPNKNLARLVAALEDIPCRLHVVGHLSDDQRATLSASPIAWHNSVDLTDDEIVGAYVGADIVAFPSTYEGFGMPILEGQSVGRPIVTSNLASMPETAGDGAVFVDPFDVASIRNGIRRVIEDESHRAEVVAAGFANTARFSAGAAADAFAGIYARVSSGT